MQRLYTTSLELLQKAQVALEEEPEVRDAVLRHRHAVGAEPEGEPGVLLRIVSDLLEHSRVYHPRPAHLEPAGALADLAIRVFSIAYEAAHVQLDARLGELEVARPEAQPYVLPEDVAGHRGQGAFEVGEGETLVYRQALNLVEHRGVGRVRVAPVDSPRANHIDGRLVGKHRPDLDRRGVSPQDQALVQEEGGLHPACRVARGDVERREVVVVGLDLWPLGHAIAHAHEEVHHVIYDPHRGMQVTLRKRHPGQRNVHRLRLEASLLLRQSYQCPPCFYVLLYLARSEVGHPADLLAVGRRQGADALFDLSDLRRASEETYPHVL